MAKGSCHRESPRGTGVILHRLQDALHDFAGLVGGDTPLRVPPQARTSPQPPTVVAQLHFGGSRWVLVVVPSSAEPELSDREWEVALLVARGATNKAIAGELGLEAPTVATHIRHHHSKWDIPHAGRPGPPGPGKETGHSSSRPREAGGRPVPGRSRDLDDGPPPGRS